MRVRCWNCRHVFCAHCENCCPRCLAGAAGKGPPCLYCEKQLRLAPKYIRERGRAITADSCPPNFGYEGNNLVCSARCGFLVAIAVMRAEPHVALILPPKWNERGRRSV